MTGRGLTEADRAWLDRAIELGRRGWGRVHPNPLVGCVLVRDGRVLAEGHHGAFGGDHAEVAALSRAGDVAGATAYVSLEPCNHEGKTPPCTEALLAAGVARVVYWAEDPGEASGGGGEWLRARGVQVEGPIGDASLWKAENPFFFGRRSGRPYVAVKLAVSVDGGIAPGPGERRWLTGAEALREVHRLRAGFDAIVVGRRTWRADDPRLTARGAVRPRTPPVRILLDRRGELTLSAAVFEDEGQPVWIVTAPGRATSLSERLGASARLIEVPAGDGGLDLEALMGTLAAKGVETLFCEGGGVLAERLLGLGLVDRIYLFRAATFLGAGRVPAFPPTPRGMARVPSTWQRATRAQRFGQDVLITLDRSD